MKFYLILILFLIRTSLTGEIIEYTFNFKDDANMEYNQQEVEIYNNILRLSPTGFWTNTGYLISADRLPIDLFQDSKGNLFYCCGHIGAPPYTTYKSSNHGTNWIDITDGFNTMIEGSDGNIYLAGDAGNELQKSYDQGNTWSNLPILAYESGALCEDNNNVLYVSTRNYGTSPWFSTNYVFRSDDYGTNWTLIYKNGHTNDIGVNYFSWIIPVQNSNLIAGYVGNLMTNGIYLSTNKGTNWIIIPGTEAQNYENGILRINSSLLYTYGASGISRSEDDGQTWQNISSGTVKKLIKADDGMFYRIQNSSIWKSPDTLTWEQTSPLIKGGTNCQVYLEKAFLQADDGKIYAGGAFNETSGYLFKSGYVSSSEVILLCNPASVKKWQSISKKETSNNGQITYEMQYSSDNGNTWSNWEEMNNNNLAGIKCSSEGYDQIKLKITLSSFNHNYTPIINTLRIQYDNGLNNDLSQVTVAPNPFKPYINNINYIKFFNLTSSFDIFIYSVTGAEIAHIQSTTQNGQYIWNVKDNQGKKLKTGVYICTIKNQQGHEKKIKFTVVR